MCVLGSGGELNALTAMVDDEGVDLGLKRRDGSRVLDLQIKARFVDEASGSKLLREKGTFVADVRQETFRPREDLGVLYVAVNAGEAQVVKAWLVPSFQLASEGFAVQTKRTGPLLRFQASALPDSSDKWRTSRLERAELVPALLQAVRDLDGV